MRRNQPSILLDVLLCYCSIAREEPEAKSLYSSGSGAVFSGVSQSKLRSEFLLHPSAFARALWRSRDLLWQFTQRNIELRHKGSHLGLIWSFFNPLLMLGLYVFVFGYIFKGSFDVLPNETKIDYALAIFLGLTVFQLFGEVLGVAPSVIVSNPNFVKKVVFPLELLPAASVGAALFHLLISLGLVLVGVIFLGPGLSLRILWLPLILLPAVPLALGLAWFFAAIGVFFRDLNQLIAFLSMTLMYASALFYPVSHLHGIAWSILRFNPILLLIDLSRDAVIWDRSINLVHLGYLTAISLIVCVLGYALFRKMSPAFADVL